MSEIETLPAQPTATTRRIRVAVVFGGRSGEHSISCATAAGVLRELDRERFDVVPVGITRRGKWVLVPDEPALLEGGRAEVDGSAAALMLSLEAAAGATLVPGGPQLPEALGAVDVVLPLLHGPFGEDGTIQGLLEMAEVRYVGSGVLASAVGMDKHFMKVVLQGAGLPVSPYVVATPSRWQRDRSAVLDAVASLHFPVFVKPARAGSSLGISRVERLEDVEAAVEAARVHDPKVIIEAGLEGREIEVGVLQGHHGEPPRTAPPGEIVMHSDVATFYDYDTKYFDTEGFSMVCPTELAPEHEAALRDIAARAFEVLECEGLARVDFFLTPTGEAVINEINTMPGFTPFSMFPVMWQAAGMSYGELVSDLIELALERPTGLR